MENCFDVSIVERRMILPGREGGMVHSVFGLSVLVIPVLYICIFLDNR